MDLTELPKENSFGQRAGKFLVAAGTFGGALSQWVIVLIIARKFGSGDLGVYASVLAVTTPIFVFGSFALREIYLSFRKNVHWNVYVRTRAMGILMSIVLYSAASLAFAWPPQLAIALGAIKVADSVSDLYFGKLQLANQWLKLGSLQVLNSAVSVAAALTVVSVGGNLSQVVGASATTSFLISIASWLACRSITISDSGTRQKNSVAMSHFELIRSGLPLVGAQLLSALLFGLPIYVLHIIGREDEIGVFAAAAYIITFGNLFGSALSTIEINRLRSLLESGGVRALLVGTMRPVLVIVATGVGLGLVALLFGQSILASVYGPGFTIPPVVLIIICVSAVIGALGYIGAVSLMLRNMYFKQVSISGLALLTSSTAAAILVGGSAFPPLLSAALVALAASLSRTLFLWVAALKRSETR